MRISKWMAIAGLTIFSAQGFSADSDLDLTVSGQITAVPTWNDGTSDVTTVDFDFTNYAGAVAAVNVDSGTQDMTLTDASLTGTTLSVAVTRPSDCEIGANDVLDANVIFMDGATEVSTNTNIDFTEGAAKTIGIRFGLAGAHGTDSGTVLCNNDGLLKYTY